MSFRGGGRYVAALVTIGLGVLQTAVGLSAVVAGPEPVGAFARGLSGAVFGLVLLPAGVDVARLRKRGLGLSVVGFAGVVVVQFVPLLAGRTTAIAVGTTLLSLGTVLYLLLNEDVFDEGNDGRELTEETNPHEFIR